MQCRFHVKCLMVFWLYTIHILVVDLTFSRYDIILCTRIIINRFFRLRRNLLYTLASTLALSLIPYTSSRWKLFPLTIPLFGRSWKETNRDLTRPHRLTDINRFSCADTVCGWTVISYLPLSNPWSSRFDCRVFRQRNFVFTT